LQYPIISILIQNLQQDPQDAQPYSWNNEEFFYKGRLYLRKQLALKSMVLSEFHSSPTANHSNFTKYYEWVKHYFSWDGMKQEIHTFMVECDTCHHNTGKTIKLLGIRQPLLLTPTIWMDISMDFIIGLPK
jgi:hypothetical protein